MFLQRLTQSGEASSEMSARIKFAQQFDAPVPVIDGVKNHFLTLWNLHLLISLFSFKSIEMIIIIDNFYNFFKFILIYG